MSPRKSSVQPINWNDANHLILRIDGIIKMDYRQHDQVRAETGKIINTLNNMNEEHVKYERLKALQLVSILMSGGKGDQGAQKAAWFGVKFVDNANNVLKALMADLTREIAFLQQVKFIEKKDFRIETLEKKEDHEITRLLVKLDEVTKSRAHKLVKDLEFKDGVVSKDDRKIMILATEIAGHIDTLLKNLAAQQMCVADLITTLYRMQRSTKKILGITDFSDFNPKFRTLGATLKTLNDQCHELYEEIKSRIRIELPIETESQKIILSMEPELVRIRDEIIKTA